MDFSIVQAIILAIIEGLTEYLPVSSTGHMVIASSLMGIQNNTFVKFFEIAIQLGAIMSVVVLYWRKFFDFKGIDFYLKLIIAFIPAAIFGVLLGDFIDDMLEKPLPIAFILLIGGIVLLFIDKWIPEEKAHTDIVNNWTAFKIGCFQVLAVIFPGLSRSAATIIGGMATGLTRKSAAEFSFFLAVPTMFAATAKKSLDFYEEGISLDKNQILIMVVGNIIAFVVAYLAIRSFVEYLTKHGFKIFGYYRIFVGLLILGLYFAGVPLFAH